MVLTISESADPALLIDRCNSGAAGINHRFRQYSIRMVI